jgi:hypothetical protein
MATIPLTQSNPELCREWHPTLNGDLTPDKVSSGSDKKVWWLGKCGHEWDSPIYNRNKLGSGCPFCSGLRVIAGKTDLETTHPEIAKTWSDRNLPKTSRDVSAGVGKTFWWIGECGHEWQAKVIERVRGRGCSICSGKKVVVGINDFESLFPDLAQEWHYVKNGDKRPEDYTRGTQKVFWWLGKCGHEWQASVKNRVSGRGCSICASKTFLVGYSDLATTHPNLAAEWHPTKNGKLTPDQVSKGLTRKVWWLGECGHEWFQPINNRNNGQGCPKCSPGGYNSVDPGILYFIHNPNLLAFKVGITNPSSKHNRLKIFRSNGWIVVETWEHSSGRLILDVETHFFRWLRREMYVPQMLDKYTMSTLQGSSETFSDSLITKRTVISKIEELLAEYEG